MIACETVSALVIGISESSESQGVRKGICWGRQIFLELIKTYHEGHLQFFQSITLDMNAVSSDFTSIAVVLCLWPAAARYCITALTKNCLEIK